MFQSPNLIERKVDVLMQNSRCVSLKLKPERGRAVGNKFVRPRAVSYIKIRFPNSSSFAEAPKNLMDARTQRIGYVAPAN